MAELDMTVEQRSQPMTLMRIVALLLFASVHATAQSGPDTAKSIEGVWIYANDPTKKIESDPVYEGSTITIEAGGRYAFALGASAMKPLEGRWTLRGAEADTFRLHTDYGRGRTVEFDAEGEARRKGRDRRHGGPRGRRRSETGAILCSSETVVQNGAHDRRLRDLPRLPQKISEERLPKGAAVLVDAPAGMRRCPECDTFY